MPPHGTPTWRHTEDGLALMLGLRSDPVPDEVGAWLDGPQGIGTSADPAEDLITLEARLAGLVAHLLTKVEQAELAIARARTDRVGNDNRWSPNARRRRRAAATELNAGITRHTEAGVLLDEARSLQHTLRRFVIELDATAGPLARAAAGWSRSPDVPAGVIVFDPQDNFLLVDSRRAEPDRGYSTVAGEVFGRQWRRDGDDALDAAPEHSGPWQLGYIPRTREIYASRHSGYLTQQVWLLGKDFSPLQAHEALTELEPRMREPNSLILAANTVHAVRSLRSTTRQRVALRHPATTGGPPTSDVGATG